MPALTAETLAIHRLALNRLLISNHSDIAQRYWRAENLREIKGNREINTVFRRHYFHQARLRLFSSRRGDAKFSASRSERDGIEVACAYMPVAAGLAKCRTRNTGWMSSTRRLLAHRRRQTPCYDQLGEKLIFIDLSVLTLHPGR